MPILLMLGWWYTSGWLWVLHQIRQKLTAIAQIFAVSVLLKTWFSPWKQIYSKSTFATFFRDAIDNLVSRLIGAIVRGAMLFCAFVLSVIVLLVGLLGLVAWPFIPLLTFILPVLAISGAGA